MGLEGLRRPLITPVDPPGPTVEVPSYLDGSWTALLSSGVCLSVCLPVFFFFFLIQFVFHSVTQFLCVDHTRSLANAFANLECPLQNIVSAQSDTLHITANASGLSLRLRLSLARLSAPRVTESSVRLTF